MHYVIKGPADGRQYLCDFAEHSCPQWWHDRDAALSFKLADEAWRYLEKVQKEHGDAGSYTGRVVRILLPSDRRVRAAQMRAHRDELIVENAELKQRIKVLEARLTSPSGSGAGGAE